MEFNQELNNKLWKKTENKGESSYSLKPEVSKKLKEIADFFIDTNDIPKEAVKDIRIVGSSCNYNYNKYSDLDLHIIVDFDKIHKDCPIVTDYAWAIKQIFNQEHDISIYGIDVEIYVEPIEQEANSNGVYSLMQDKWLKVPEKIKPTKNDSAVQAKFNEIKEAIDKIEDSEYADKLLDKIYSMRKAGLESGGEFSTENITFKLLRNGGYLDKLRTMKKKKIDKNLTLENLTFAEDAITDKIQKAIDAIYKKTNYTAYITYDAKRDEDYFYNVVADIVSNQDMDIAKELIDDFINNYELKNDGLKIVYNRIKFSLDSKYGKDFVKEHSSELQRMISEQINIVPDYNSFLNQNIPVDIIVGIKDDKDYKIYDKDNTTVIGVGKSVKFLLDSQGYNESDFIEYCNSTEDYDTNTFLGSLAYNQANNIYDYEEIKPFFLGSIWLPDLLNTEAIQINTDCTYGIANKYLSGGYCVGNALKKPISLNSSDIDIELTNYRLTGVFNIDKHAWDSDITIEKSKNEKLNIGEDKMKKNDTYKIHSDKTNFVNSVVVARNNKGYLQAYLINDEVDATVGYIVFSKNLEDYREDYSALTGGREELRRKWNNLDIISLANEIKEIIKKNRLNSKINEGVGAAVTIYFDHDPHHDHSIDADIDTIVGENKIICKNILIADYYYGAHAYDGGYIIFEEDAMKEAFTNEYNKYYRNTEDSEITVNDIENIYLNGYENITPIVFGGGWIRSECEYGTVLDWSDEPYLPTIEISATVNGEEITLTTDCNGKYYPSNEACDIISDPEMAARNEYPDDFEDEDEDTSEALKSTRKVKNKGVNEMKKRINEDAMGYWDLVDNVKDCIKEGNTVNDAIYSTMDNLVYYADVINIWSDIPGSNSEIIDLMREDIEQELYGEEELQDYASSLEDDENEDEDEDTSEALKLSNKSRKNKSLISEKRKSSKKYSILEEAHNVLTMNETSEGGDLTTWQFSAKGFSKAGLEKQSTFGSANLRCIIHENSNGNLVGTVTTDYGMTEEQIRENLINALRDNGFRTTSITDLTLLY